MLTTPFFPALPLCSHVRWWRMIVDEPQLGASILNDREHLWVSQHRWLLTGTPSNATGAGLGATLCRRCCCLQGQTLNAA